MAAAGTVYLLHFDRPYVHAGHYTGWTTDLPARLAEHASGHGARLTGPYTLGAIVTLVSGLLGQLAVTP